MRNRVHVLVLTALVSMVGTGFAQAPKDLQDHKSCTYCGMDRAMYDFSRMLVEYEDGTTTPACSLHCVAIDLANRIDKAPGSILVADFQTRQLINAETAVWVLEGNKPGIMSKRGKWAFATKGSAEVFLASNGGRLASFDQAIKLAYEDMYEDTLMIRSRRKAKKMSMAMPAPVNP